jgi:hypothetical protein
MLLFLKKNMSTPAEVSSIMKEIETKTEANVVALTQSGQIANPLSSKPRSNEDLQTSINVLQQVMSDAGKEFESKTGRPEERNSRPYS